jgi:hypothetical protein
VKGPCFFCQRTALLEVQHIAGRIDGVPIHRTLVVGTCGPCNLTQYKLWKYAGLDARNPGVAVKLRRVATFFAIRNHDLDEALATFLVTQAEELEMAS